jgi:D-glycero-D-manno-heptose 1,7-bisphosphate phosphatase
VNRAVFLDRDGTINEESPYIADIRDLHIYPFTADAIRRLNESAYLVIVVTNQSGVGRGLIPPERLNEIHAYIQRTLSTTGARIDAFYACTHTPEEGCACRKPAPGMILQALRDYEIDPARSFFVGDKREDLLAARAAGVTPILVRTGYGRETEALPEVQPVFVVNTLAEAVTLILSR